MEMKVLDSADRNIDPNYTGITHPLLKNWQEPTIKRALKDAVDSKADYFAWISGGQTSARYNLATHIDEVKWGKANTLTDATDTGKVITLKPKQGDEIIAYLNDDGTIRRGGMGDWKGKKLDEVLGKGLADKIMGKKSGTLSGEGLKFGGEWADNLYDKQVRDIVQKLTGGKVEMIDLGLPKESFMTSGKATTQQAIKLTYEIKAKILGKAPSIKTSGKQFEDPRPQLTDLNNQAKKPGLDPRNLYGK